MPTSWSQIIVVGGFIALTTRLAQHIVPMSTCPVPVGARQPYADRPPYHHGQVDQDVQNQAVAQGNITIYPKYRQGDNAQIME